MTTTLEAPAETKTAERTYFENLDGLRFFCFLSVFLYHSFHTSYDAIREMPVYQFIKADLVGNGNIGVNFFFVLSGFLITFLLIQEKQVNGQIDLKKFWLRRILRIWPLFYFCVFFGFVCFPLLKAFFGQRPDETASLLHYLTFLNNFDFIAKGPPDASILGVLWSVGVEEQFYLVWPVLLVLFPVRQYWIVFCAVIIGSLLFRASHDTYAFREYHTFSCIGDMAVGAFGAWLVAQSVSFRNYVTSMKPALIIVIYTIFFAFFFFRDELLTTTHALRVTERLILAVVILFIILEQNYARASFFKLSQFRTVTRLGRITYGLYCLHFIGILIATTLTRFMGLNDHLWQVILLETSLAFIVSIALGKISYSYYERPFLKLKNRLSPF